MKTTIQILMAGLFLITAGTVTAAAGISDIDNYRQYSPYFSSSGQPSKKQLKAVADAGFERVIYLAFTDNKTAIESEDRAVKSLGMDYLHIPVDFDQPTARDFEDFASVLNQDKEVRTLLHCQINLRASAFSFLFRVIYGDVPMADAKSDLDAIWQPDKVWYRFIVNVLKQHDLSHECDTCDWGTNDFND